MDTPCASIRAGRAGDAAEVVSLWTETYVADATGGRRDPYTQADYEHSAGNGEVYVAEEGGAVVGVVVMLPPGSPAARTATAGEGEVSRLAIAPRVRRRGLATALMERCRRRGIEAGCAALVLWTRPAQRDAHRLYERLGYERAPGRDASDPGGRRLVYRLPLNESGTRGLHGQ